MKNYILRLKRGVEKRIEVAGDFLKYLLCRMIPRFDKRKSWVICERGTDARDNGYAFYRYIVQEHPEIRISYLITTNSPDYSKVREHAVAYGSWRNYRVVAKAEKIISTHCYTALPVKHEKTWRIFGLEKRFYFLQHGITQSKMPYMFGDRTGMRLFCCAAVPEYAFVRDHYRHPAKVVQCTGFARHDHIFSFAVKQQILIMPTWRRYLRAESTFLQSDYYSAWRNVLQDETLLKYLEDTQTQLVFYLHYELQPYLKHFTSRSPNVILADFKNYDVQALLKESKLLVTDYSSVHFDFAYMQKPCIYYQFDSERYYQQHYQEGYYRYERDGFGPVAKDHEDLVSQILNVAGNDYEMRAHYQNKVRTFFAHHDQNNCERIYQAIVNC